MKNNIASAAFATFVAASGSAAAQQNQPPPPPQVYATDCAGCHGNDLKGGSAPTLFSEEFQAAHTDEGLHDVIAGGKGAMPAFKDKLSDDQIRQLVAYLRIQGGTFHVKPFVRDPNGQVVHSEKQDFRVEVVASGLVTPWGEVFLPDGRLLVTERPGRIRIIDHGKLLPDPVKGTPVPFVKQDGGYFDIAIHPDYRKNGWIYLSYSEVLPGAPVPATGNPLSMTRLIRGRINRNNEWVDEQEIFRAPANIYTNSIIHYGSRFLFDGNGHLFWTMGERGDMANAQNLGVPLGKIHRINDDGTIPKDNPFVNTPGALPSIWSYGHRNPEGLAFDPVTGLLWETEHGPTGGDEINIIEPGKNYGWGVVSMGLQPGITHQSQDGMVPPITYFTPTVGPSGISFYTGSQYPNWKNDLFISALVGQKLFRLEIKDRQIAHMEPLYVQFGRTRDVITGPDGLLYVLLQTPTGPGTGMATSADSPGMVVRLVPVNSK